MVTAVRLLCVLGEQLLYRYADDIVAHINIDDTQLAVTGHLVEVELPRTLLLSLY